MFFAYRHRSKLTIRALWTLGILLMFNIIFFSELCHSLIFFVLYFWLLDKNMLD